MIYQKTNKQTNKQTTNKQKTKNKKKNKKRFTAITSNVFKGRGLGAFPESIVYCYLEFKFKKKCFNQSKRIIWA